MERNFVTREKMSKKMKKQKQRQQKRAMYNSLLFRDSSTETEIKDLFGDCDSFQIAKRIVSVCYNIELGFEAYERLFESLDKENKEYASQNPCKYGVWAAGALSDEMNRDGFYY
jgi:hypothetical protein